MKTGLLTSDNVFISIPYYEIGSFAENICNEYIARSEKNKMQFDVFASNYHYFKPHLDFLLFELGYKMINPLLRENTVWYAEHHQLYLKTSSMVHSYVPVRDDALMIQYIEPENLSSCVVDFNGVSYNIPKGKEIYHEDIYELVLNQYLIYDKQLFKIYQDYMGQGLNIVSFCRNMLGFYHIAMYSDKSGYILYCSDFYNSYMDNVCQRIQEVYPKMEIDSEHIHTEADFKVATQCIERVNYLHENRRLRF